MRKFYCRENDQDPWIIIEHNFPQEAAEAFGDEQGLEDESIVEVQGHGKYKLHVIMEPEISATKVT